MTSLGKKLQESLTEDSLKRISGLFEEAKDITAELEKIAKEELGIETFETRDSDSLDFYDCSVWSIKKALELAYELGKASK